jgi:hypothetical protein
MKTFALLLWTSLLVAAPASAGFVGNVAGRVVGAHVEMKLRHAEMDAHDKAVAEAKAAHEADPSVPATPAATPFFPHPSVQAFLLNKKMSWTERLLLFIGNPMVSLAVSGALALLVGGLWFMRRHAASAPVGAARTQADFQARADARMRMAMRAPARS